jgi:hypothetical protein
LPDAGRGRWRVVELGEQVPLVRPELFGEDAVQAARRHCTSRERGVRLVTVRRERHAGIAPAVNAAWAW